MASYFWTQHCRLACGQPPKSSPRWQMQLSEWRKQRASHTSSTTLMISGECQQSLDHVLSLFNKLGIPLAPDKLEGPSTTLTFLGIEIDTVAMEIRLPVAKLQALQVTIQSWLGKQACSQRDLESLLGSLVHACCVLKEGKTFL